MSKLIIHRGTKEIGGSTLEISNGRSKLLFDFGIPLESMEKPNYNPEDYKLAIKGLYIGEKPLYKAVFLTHAHLDHCGMINLINPKIPVYVSRVTYNILTKILPLLEMGEYKFVNNLKIIEDELIDIDGISIRAYEVDHSIAGACAYEINVSGKTIVYTGDLRFHGRASWKSSVFKRKVKNPDYLIMEGTTLNRIVQNKKTEKDLESEFVKIFKCDSLPLVQFSPQNIDRFITVYRACLKTGKILVIDPYTGYVLEAFKPISKKIPQFDWNNIMVYFARSKISKKLGQTKELFKYKSKKITEEEILKNPQKYVIKGNWSINNKILNKIGKDKIKIIYSMWEGYLDRPNQFEDCKDALFKLHTSGHAYLEDLQKYVQEVNPKNLIPIHTECKKLYTELFDAHVIELSDGQIFSL